MGDRDYAGGGNEAERGLDPDHAVGRSRAHDGAVGFRADGQRAQVGGGRRAASATVRAIGPAVSCEWAIGIMPVAGMRPSVGLIPTTPLVEAGHTMEPSVSVPMASAHRLAETAAPDPELEPQALRSSA